MREANEFDGVAAILLVFMLFFLLFAGDPDIADAIREWIGRRG